MAEKLNFHIDKKYCFRVSLIYFAAVLFANIMANSIPLSMNFPVMMTDDMIKWKNFVDSKDVLINSLTFLVFLVPSLICLSYSFSILFAKDELIVAKKVVNLPLRFSLMGFLGWFLQFLLEVVFCIYAKNTMGINLSYILMSSAVFVVLEAIFSFVVSYFVTETVNRSAVLPRIFPEGNVSKIPGVKKFSLNFLFIIFFITVSLFPIIFILSAFISVQVNNQLPISWNTIRMSIILFVSSLVLTIVFMRIFTVPLKSLTEATRKITNGDYSVKVKNISNDEMGILSDTFNDMTESLQEKEFMRGAFGKMVDPCVRDYLLSGNVSLGGENADVTVMFCDIRNFTSMSENMNPKEIVLILNKYFTAMEKCITNNNGIINKYIGDAIMAIFGTPIKSENCNVHNHNDEHSEKNHALDSFNASLEMKKSLVELNKSLAEKNLPELDFGIGLHSGEVLAGNIGTENRMEYTVIGDTVNTASRIGSLCKTYKSDLLISENTANQILKTNSQIYNSLKFIADAEIRGKTETVKLYSW